LVVEGDSLELGKDVFVFEGHDTRVSGDAYYYPALSMPMGGKEEFSCPPEHIEQAKQRLRACSALLVLGFSGFDTHVVKLFTPLSKFRRFSFVNQDRKAAWEAAQRFLGDARAGVLAEDITENVGFGRFVGDEHLERFLSIVPK
jgi:hypothetical protein